jgi:hypothetical protein
VRCKHVCFISFGEKRWGLRVAPSLPRFAYPHPANIAAQRIREQTMTLEHGRTRYTRGCRCDAYCCGRLGGLGTGRGRGVFCPQFRPIMQSQPPAWGWTASSQQTSSGDEGVGTSVDEGSALVYGTPAPPTPPSARASTAAPPHAAAIVLPVRFATTPNFNFSALNVHSRTAALCRGGALRVAPSLRDLPTPSSLLVGRGMRIAADDPSGRAKGCGSFSPNESKVTGLEAAFGVSAWPS